MVHQPTLYDCHQLSQADFEDYSFERVLAWDTNPLTWRKLVMEVKIKIGVTSVNFCLYRLNPFHQRVSCFKTLVLAEAVNAYNTMGLISSRPFDR